MLDRCLAETLNSVQSQQGWQAPLTCIAPMFSISWSALEGRQRLVTYSLDNLKAYLAGTPTNVVNM